MSDPGHRILVSSASAWEIATKHRLGQLTGVDALAADVTGWVSRAGFEELLVTADRAFEAFETRVVW